MGPASWCMSAQHLEPLGSVLTRPASASPAWWSQFLSRQCSWAHARMGAWGVPWPRHAGSGSSEQQSSSTSSLLLTFTLCTDDAQGSAAVPGHRGPGARGEHRCKQGCMYSGHAMLLQAPLSSRAPPYALQC